jgi:uncharacterized protein
MDFLRQTYYIEHIEFILIFGLVGYVLNKIAFHKNYYKLPLEIPFFKTRVAFVHVLVGFAIYLLNSAFTAPLILNQVHSFFSSNQVAAAWTLVSVMFLSFILLWGFCKISLRDSFSHIWKGSFSTSSFFNDAILAIITWFLAYPVVAVVEQAADILVYALFGVETYEQVAVLYLKAALKSPSQLVAVILMVIVAAPLLEEFLFRGLFQTWLKKHLGVKAAILITSLCFALFHVSAAHGVGNLSLVPSLFTLSCFLGFIYERQKSLFASIVLHSTFNLVSTLRIIFTIDTI